MGFFLTRNLDICFMKVHKKISKTNIILVIKRLKQFSQPATESFCDVLDLTQHSRIEIQDKWYREQLWLDRYADQAQ